MGRIASSIAALIVAVVSLWAQAAPEAGAAKGKAKGAAKGNAPQAESAPLPPPVPQVLRLVRPNTYLVTGHGANTTFRVTPAGVILIDTKLPNPGDFERLMELIRGVTPQPVKFVINTSASPASTGNNAKFQAAGAEIVTTERTITLGGAEARVTRSTSGGIVYFPDTKLVCIGDLKDPNTLNIDWKLGIPSQGEPLYKGRTK